MRLGILVKTLPPWGYGGNPREAIYIANALHAEGNDVTVICFSPRRLNFKEFVVVPMKPFAYPHHLGDLLPVPQVFVTTLKTVKKLNLDILLAFCAGSSEGIATPLVAKITGIPCVIRTTGNDILVDLHKYPFLIKPPLMLCDAIVPINEHMQNMILRHLPTVRRKIQIIPVSVDINLFSPDKDGSKVRTMYQMEGAFIILTVAPLVERKGIAYLVMAMKFVLQEEPNAKLIIIGDGPERHSLMTLAQKLNITANVIFKKFISDDVLPEYYNACNIFVLPSVVDKKGGVESFGKVLAEALACGKPVIGTKVGGIPTLVQDGRTGFLVEQRQPESLASAILKLRNNTALQRRMGEYGRNIVVENYANEKVMKQWVTLFKNLMV